MKKILITFALAMLSFAANAQTNTAPGTVTTSTFSDGGNLFFATTAPPLNPAGCAASSYVIASTNAQFTHYYAIMLTAASSGQDVVVNQSTR